jgi:hypothetical protein
LEKILLGRLGKDRKGDPMRLERRQGLKRLLKNSIFDRVLRETSLSG